MIYFLLNFLYHTLELSLGKLVPLSTFFALSSIVLESPSSQNVQVKAVLESWKHLGLARIGRVKVRLLLAEGVKELHGESLIIVQLLWKGRPHCVALLYRRRIYRKALRGHPLLQRRKVSSGVLAFFALSRIHSQLEIINVPGIL
mmetsp:Transcript_27872/g.5092  ORF Transcript_27872/g.5092 Transcript_27872/m.5092 type:complete len:145 (+) Transcript_27872:1084-1518(+)